MSFLLALRIPQIDLERRGVEFRVHRVNLKSCDIDVHVDNTLDCNRVVSGDGRVPSPRDLVASVEDSQCGNCWQRRSLELRIDE